MKVVNVIELFDTDREVDCPKGGFKSLRILLASDGMGYTMTKTYIPKNDPQFWHYKNHLETCFCIKGRATLKNLNDGKTYLIYPGTAYILDKHDPHTLEAHEDTELICVFNPPLTGREVHQEDGSYKESK